MSGYPLPGLRASGSSNKMSRGGANRSALERKTPCDVPEWLGSAFPGINHHNMDMNVLCLLLVEYLVI